MKSLKLDEYQVTIDGERPASTLNLIEMCLDQPPVGGYKPKDLRECNRIQSYIDKARSDGSESIDIEDADAVVLKKIVERSSFFVRHVDVTRFIESIESL